MLSGTPTSSALQGAGNLALRPDDVRPEIRPGAGRVVAQTHQEDLRFVLEEELARQPVQEAEREERREGDGRQRHAAPEVFSSGSESPRHPVANVANEANEIESRP